jgi:hypothetical protein
MFGTLKPIQFQKFVAADLSEINSLLKMTAPLLRGCAKIRFKLVSSRNWYKLLGRNQKAGRTTSAICFLLPISFCEKMIY